MTKSNQDKESGIYRRWCHSPELFVRECLGVTTITNQQGEALEAIRVLVNIKRRVVKGEVLTEAEKELSLKIGISIMSGHRTGKDAWAAWMILWFLYCFPRPLVLCTAPTATQLENVLWSEITKWLNMRNDKGEYACLIRDAIVVHSDKIFFKDDGNKERFALARTSAANASLDQQAETLAGFNADFKMIVIDEATGIAPGVFKPLEGGLGGKCNFVLMIFNPTRANCFAVDSHNVMKDKSRWITLRWNAEDCELVSKSHIEMMAAKYGRSSNHYRIRVLGLPPTADPDTLIPWDWVDAAVERGIIPLDDDPSCLGVDVGAGGDKSVIVTRRGGVVENIACHDSKDTMELVGWTMNEAAKTEDSVIFVDPIGIGKGVYDRLAETGQRVFAIDVRKSPKEPERFMGGRDELWWGLREQFEKGIISIPRNEELIEQLKSIRYTVPSGKIRVESKRELKTRGFGSPDEADALCLSFAMEDRLFRRGAQTQDDYSEHSSFRTGGNCITGY